MIRRPDPPRHEEIHQLIPWWVNGTLSPDDAAEVSAHLETCGECRAEVAVEERIRGTMRQTPRIEYAPQASLQKLLGRIEAPQSSAAAGARGVTRSGLARHASHWRFAAAMALAVALGLLGATLWTTPPRIYRTATTAGDLSGDAVQVRVVFAPSMTIDDLTRLARESGLSIVSGPSESGVYGLALAPGQRATASEVAAQLRQDPRVRFAEPVADSPALR